MIEICYFLFHPVSVLLCWLSGFAIVAAQYISGACFTATGILGSKSCTFLRAALSEKLTQFNLALLHPYALFH